MQKVKIVTEIIAATVKTRCPNCGEYNEGWCCDPRGEEDTCEYCGIPYKIHPEADIEFY